MINRVAFDRTVRSRFLHDSSESPSIRTEAFVYYRRQVERFLKLLLLAIHLTYSQPAKGAELLSVLHTTSHVTSRNTILSNRRAWLAINYNELGVHPIYRYLSGAVGESLYSALVHP